MRHAKLMKSIRSVTIGLVSTWAIAATLSKVGACPFCSNMGKTLAENVAESGLVVYGKLSNAKLIPDAKPGDPDGTTELEIMRVVKAHPILKDKKMLTLGRYIPPAEKEIVNYLIFAEVIDGRIDPYRGMPIESTDFVEYLVGSVNVAKSKPAERLGFFFQYLDHQDVNISGDAYKEFAAAPYKDVVAAAKHFQPDRIVRWLGKDKDTPSYRIGLYGLLLGVCGKPEHAKVLRDIVEDARSRPLTGIDGLLGGYCVLDPEQGPDYVLATLSDPQQEFNTRYAALRTVRFLLTEQWRRVAAPVGNADSGGSASSGTPPASNAVDKQRIFELMTPSLQIADMSDLIIDEFRKNKYWAPSATILGLYGHPPFDLQVIRRAVIRFAIKCPDQKSKAFVAKLRKEDPQLVADVEEILKFEETQQVQQANGK